jgi:hypothetical protein
MKNKLTMKKEKGHGSREGVVHLCPTLIIWRKNLTIIKEGHGSREGGAAFMSSTTYSSYWNLVLNMIGW